MKKLPQMVKHYWENITWLEVIFILGLSFLMMYGLLCKLGTLTSGYHFLDDHELIRLEVAFKDWGKSLGSVMKEWTWNDLSWRFRPFYWVERTVMAFFFGSNLLYWNLYTAVKGVITFALLYFAARFLKCNPLVSGVFTCLILYGAQFTPWYRSANQENTGLLLCALTLCLIAAQSYYQKYLSKMWNCSIVLAAVGCGLMKESFTLLLPAFAAFRFWLEYRVGMTGGLWKCIHKHWLIYVTLLAAFAADVCILLFVVGVDRVSYAGFHEGSGLTEYWQGIVLSYQRYLRWYINLSIPLLLLLATAGKRKWKKYAGFWLIGIYVIGVQLVVHAKSGMWERYLIPWIVGYAAVFVIQGCKMLKHRKIVSVVYFGILCILVCIQAPTVLTKGRDYAYDGHMTSLYFQTILDHTDEESHIVCMFYDEELNLSSECWLETHGRTQVYSMETETDELVNLVQLRGTAPTTLDLQGAQAYTCYDNQVEEVLVMLGLTDSVQYSVSVNGHYAVISPRKQ